MEEYHPEYKVIVSTPESFEILITTLGYSARTMAGQNTVRDDILGGMFVMHNNLISLISQSIPVAAVFPNKGGIVMIFVCRMVVPYSNKYIVGVE